MATQMPYVRTALQIHARKLDYFRLLFAYARAVNLLSWCPKLKQVFLSEPSRLVNVPNLSSSGEGILFDWLTFVLSAALQWIAWYQVCHCKHSCYWATGLSIAGPFYFTLWHLSGLTPNYFAFLVSCRIFWDAVKGVGSWVHEGSFAG